MEETSTSRVTLRDRLSRRRKMIAAGSAAALTVGVLSGLGLGLGGAGAALQSHALSSSAGAQLTFANGGPVIQVNSWSWGMSQSGSLYSSGGGSSGRLAFQDLHFTKDVDSSTIKLFALSASKIHVPWATLEVDEPSPDGTTPGDAFTILLGNVVISSVADVQSPNGSPPIESFSLNFTKITVKYTEQDATTPPVPTGWDLAQNKKL